MDFGYTKWILSFPGVMPKAGAFRRSDGAMSFALANAPAVKVHDESLFRSALSRDGLDADSILSELGRLGCLAA